METPHPLNYQLRSRTRRRWIVLSVVGVALLLIVLGTTNLIRGARTHLRQIQQMREDRRLMAYEAPTGLVAFDDTQGAPVVGDPSVTPFGGTVARLFMHGRRTTSGQEALIVIALIAPRSRHGEHLSITLYEPATINRWTRHHGSDVAWDSPPLVAGPPKKIHAGRADPGDNSHFTIDFEINGSKQTLDGWLIDVPRTPSGGTMGVKFSVRNTSVERIAAP